MHNKISEETAKPRDQAIVKSSVDSAPTELNIETNRQMIDVIKK